MAKPRKQASAKKPVKPVHEAASPRAARPDPKAHAAPATPAASLDEAGLGWIDAGKGYAEPAIAEGTDDSRWPVPELGALCVDRSDALLVARKFSQSGQPQDNPTDLDLDGTTGFADYAIALSRFTPGGCGQPDPYVPRAPIVCRGSQILVIDGEAIENGGITVEARGSCNILIRNSLIVSGFNALDIRGAAVITADRSIIVGERAVLSSLGGTLLFARNSIFHGPREIIGPFVFVDLGGNTFE